MFCFFGMEGFIFPVGLSGCFGGKFFFGGRRGGFIFPVGFRVRGGIFFPVAVTKERW